MKYLVTALAMTQDTRRRMGKSWTEIVESERGPYSVELHYEREFNITRPNETCKVIDVGEIHSDRDGACVCGAPVAKHFTSRNRKLSCEKVHR